MTVKNYSHTMVLSSVGEHLGSEFELLGAKVESVIKRALKKLSKWLRTHSVREIGKNLKITQKALKKRFFITFNDKGDMPYINIWFGLLNVSAHEAGKPNQNRSGTRVKSYQFDGAFIQKIYGGDQKVYIRASRNREFNHATVAQRPGRVNRYPDRKFLAKNSDRFPVQVVGIKIEDEARKILERYESRINSRYEKILEQELNFALNIESRS